MLRKFSFLILLIVLIFTGCYRSQRTSNPEYELFVFAENDDYKKLEATLQSVFDKEILTPQPETHFKLVRVDPKTFNESLNNRQLLFAASLQSEGDIAGLVNRSVNQPGIIGKVKSGENFLFKREDEWTKDQMILTLVAPTIDDLIEKISINKDFIYNYFHEFQQKVVFNYVYGRLEDKKMPEEILEKYQWKVRIPHDYFIDVENPEDNFILLRRRIPERWIFIKWFEGVDPNIITPEWVYDLRDTLGVHYTGGTKINRKYTNANVTEFLDRWCLKVEGLWEQDEQVAGGPFFSYAFYDEGTQRAYVIDCATFAPNKKKIPYLDQMDAIAQTFKTKVEIQREETD